MGEQRRRRRLDAAAWAQVMQRFAASGMTVERFCAAEGLSASSLHRWRARVGPAGSRAVTTPPTRAGAPSSRASAAGFIELGCLSGAASHSSQPLAAAAQIGTGAAFELRLELGGGLVLQLWRR